MVVSRRQSLFFLVNDSVNEPASFSQRLKWKRDSNPINLLVQYYADSSAERQAEIDECLKKNVENEYIDKIYLFIDNENVKVPQFAAGASKVIPVRLNRRLKFKDAFAYCSEHLSEQVCIVANSGMSISSFSARARCSNRPRLRHLLRSNFALPSSASIKW